MAIDNEHWGHTIENPIAYEKWHRSWRQEINTSFGQLPTLFAWMETVTRYADGRVEVSKWPTPIELKMNELSETDLAIAIAVRTSLTELIGTRIEVILNPPAPPEPLPSPEEPTPSE